MKILILVKDLFFQTRLEGGLIALGHEPAFVAGSDDLTHRLSEASLVIVDLAARQTDPIEAIRAARGARPDLPVLAFGSHKDLDARQRAIDAGATRVVANSALATDLAGIVGKLVGNPDRAT